MDPKVTIIILNWNGWNDTIECLESLYQINYNNYDIIVIDNHSEDDSIQKIKNYFHGKINTKSIFVDYDPTNKPLKYFEYVESEINIIDEQYDASKNIILIKNYENYGFAEGNNIGIRFSLKYLKPEYILLLNNDTIVDKYFLDKLVSNSADNKNIALSQPKLLKYENPTVIDSTGGILDRYGFGISRGSNENDIGKYDKSSENDFFYVLGTCMLISVEFINETNPNEFLDSYIFAVHDDVDINWYARILGYKITYCPDSICYHKQHKSFKKKPPSHVSFLFFKNSIRILLKYYSFWNLMFYLAIKLTIEGILSFGRIIINNDTTNFKCYIKAIVWNIKNLNDTLRRRKKIQSKRNIDDNYIIKYMKLKSIQISNLRKQH